MNTRRWFLPLAVLAAVLAVRPGLAQGPKRNPVEEAALLKNAEAFVAAFHKGDAKALAALWTVDGDYTDMDGRVMKGRDAIEKAFVGFFAHNKGLKLRIDIAELRFVTPDVAIEDGKTEVIPPDGGPPSRARYTIVHVKKDGKWCLSSVRDAAYAPPSNYEHLHQLEWAIGSWASETDKGGEVARYTFTWGEGQNFIDSSFTTTFKNISIGGGTMRVGWDASTKRIRTWTFYTDGGFGEGSGTKEGAKWVFHANFVLRDGTKLEATNHLTMIDPDTITWQTTGRTVNGKQVPDTAAVTMKRVK